MFAKQRKASTDPRLRSLLQKAARRGYPHVVELTARRLNDAGDRTWLRSRAVVITFEECWPLAERLSLTKEPETRRRALVEVAKSVKQKDAAGLGALAYAYHEGDASMLDVVPSDWALRMVSEALDRSVAFFDWATSHSTSDAGRRIVEAARRYLAAATWGWDKTCILAGAFLAATGEVPLCGAGPVFTSDFPYWVALDKHTPEGKQVLQQLGVELRVTYRQLIWAGFYFESAAVNSLLDSPWWSAEVTWRLRKAGLTTETGAALWERVRLRLSDRVAAEAHALRAMVEAQGAIQHGFL